MLLLKWIHGSEWGHGSTGDNEMRGIYNHNIDLFIPENTNSSTRALFYKENNTRVCY